jgi:hypothetical protein
VAVKEAPLARFVDEVCARHSGWRGNMSFESWL